MAKAKATAEDVAEMNRLIDVAQMRGASIKLEDREAAIIELISRFQFLIRKIAKSVWRPNRGVEWAEWEHDAQTVFLELLVDDYVPKHCGGASGFTHYIQQKLYYRLLHKAQQELKRIERVTLADLGTEEQFEEAGDRGASHNSQEIQRAALQLTTELEDDVLSTFRTEDIKRKYDEILEIAKRVLDERETYVFKNYYLSGTYVRDIGPAMVPPISRARVLQLVKTVRDKIWKELGRRALGEQLS
jgi:hypothetical protein